MGGEVRGPGPRSLEALRWVERLDAVGLEALACAVGFGRRAAYSHVSRLGAAGLLERVYDREGSLVAVTPAGRRLARPDRVNCRSVRRGVVRSRAAHARAISWVAARATLRAQLWTGERDLDTSAGWRFVMLAGERRTHRADLGVIVDGARLAVEVELTAKAPARLRAILSGYEHQIRAGALDGVVYVCDDPLVERAVQRAAGHAELGDRVFRQIALSQIIAEARALALRRFSLFNADLSEHDVCP